MGKAKVNELQVPIFTHHDVLCFYITVHNPLLMKLSDSDHYLCDVELDNRLAEVSMISEDLVKLTTSNKGHHKVKPLICLEEVLHAAEEWMMGFKQYLLFV